MFYKRINKHLKIIKKLLPVVVVLLLVLILLSSCSIKEEKDPLVVELKQRIDDGQAYLFRMYEPGINGIHKFYYAEEDRLEERVHTIYTSSSVYTLMKLYDYSGEDHLWQQALKSGEFILSMQETDPESRRYGAFSYSYFLDPLEREEKYVVGTTSKTIFTLLELYRRTQDEKYLISAKAGADWLLTMIRDDGSMTPHSILREDGKWYRATKESHLFNGQVLSALSRVYRVTKDDKYLTGAQKIAGRFEWWIGEEGCYLYDDYRSKNPISSSWAIMALSDFYLASGRKDIRQIVFDCSDELILKQLEEGRWQDSYTTSGTGWIGEVLMEIYKICEADDMNYCERFTDPVKKALPWLFARTFDESNSGDLPNPQRAHGGLYWNHQNKYVRTDSVAHGMNAYIDLMMVLK
ncbi:hypothetical protein KJ652_03965 [Patescibacteria group bacterium]|nr:hypothetical protein [Patescibacteria group bacterium]MBU1123721.1 hypothetical protein [Patescibacteria group bacterium]MBU1910813.1 hypothetical protein [Patescibacteria group bacterium]